MKILEVLFSLSSGGAERFTVDLCNELSKTDDVTLITLKDETVEPDKRNFYKSDLSNRVQYMNIGLADGFSLSTEWKIYQIIKNLSPDIVHLNGGNLPKFCCLAICLLNNRIKFVQTIHNDLHNGYDCGFSRLLYNTFGRWKKYFCVALSKNNHDDFKAFYPKLNIECIVNGRAKLKATDKFDDVKRELDGFRNTGKTVLFLHVARCHSQKNQKLLVAAFNKLHEEDKDVALVIIGSHFDTPEGQAILADAGPSIHYIGIRKNIADYFMNADVFTLSSIFEGMPISLIEASLCGLPAVSTPVCGAVDLIKDGVNGMLAKDFSLTSYSSALNYAVEHYKELRTNAENMVADSPYTMEICAKKYRKLFKTLLWRVL